MIKYKGYTLIYMALIKSYTIRFPEHIQKLLKISSLTTQYSLEQIIALIDIIERKIINEQP